MAFEEHMKQLRELTQQLEQGNLPLEEAVKLYTQGMQLAASCQEELQTAKLQVETQTVPVEGQEENVDGSEA
ncbi:MAG: exodeoxyribonuclease VII small subunit [Ruminococcus sp.]|nr:exodeoxyribonuclease VII small subunit [Ruminococcus sp.]